MSIQVRSFEYIPGENDAEYIKLLKKNLEEQTKLTAKAVAKIRKLSKTQCHWIPCSERLPELYERVLVTDGEDVEMSKLSRMSNEGYIWLFETCWNDCEDWPYWMPLPEPWRGDEE